MTTDSLYLARLRAIQATLADAERIAERMGGPIMRLDAEKRRRMLAAALMAETRDYPPHDSITEPVPV